MNIIKKGYRRLFCCLLRDRHFFDFEFYEGEDWDKVIFKEQQPCHACGKMIPDHYEKVDTYIKKLEGTRPPLKNNKS